jgi:hypothetical protein
MQVGLPIDRFDAATLHGKILVLVTQSVDTPLGLPQRVTTSFDCRIAASNTIARRDFKVEAIVEEAVFTSIPPTQAVSSVASSANPER